LRFDCEFTLMLAAEIFADSEGLSQITRFVASKIK